MQYLRKYCIIFLEENKMNDNEGFKLLSNLEKTINYINKELLNFPKYDTVLRNQIELTMYQMVECIHSYRISTITNIKSKNLNDFIYFIFYNKN